MMCGVVKCQVQGTVIGNEDLFKDFYLNSCNKIIQNL